MSRSCTHVHRLLASCRQEEKSQRVLETKCGVAARLSVLGQPACVSEFIPRQSVWDQPICLHYILIEMIVYTLM